MDKKQAAVVADAVLEPDIRSQEKIRLQRAADQVQRSLKHRIAWFALAGFVIGASVAYFTGSTLLPGFVLGGLLGSLVGYVISRRAAA